jgi:hypothetical protein
MRWALYLPHIWEGGVETYTGILWRNLRERDHLVDPAIDRRIMLKWNFRNGM